MTTRTPFPTIKHAMAYDRVIANTRKEFRPLVAAAPELLEALQSLMAIISEGYCPSRTYNKFDLPFAQAKQAISRATGE